MEPTNKAAISYYRSFQKAIEKVQTLDPALKSAAYKSQISQMEINLKNIKKIEPEYNTQELEVDLEKYKSAIDNLDSKKSLDKDLISIQKGLDNLNKLLSETKLNLDNIEDTVKRSTEPMERDVQIFKKNHPEYDTSGFTNQIEEFKTKLKEKLTGAKDHNTTVKSDRKNLEDVVLRKWVSIRTVKPDWNDTFSEKGIRYEYTEEEIQKFHAFLANIQEQSQVYINSNDLEKLNATISGAAIKSQNNERGRERLSFEESSASAVLKTLIDNLEFAEIEITEKQTALTTNKSDVDVLDYFNTILLIHQWNTAAKIFYSISEINRLSELCNTLKETIGTFNQYKDRLQQNRNKLAKKVLMPSAVSENEEIKALVKTAFENKGWNESILKINLLSHDWSLARNSELIIGRTFNAAIATKNKEGNCMLYVATIRQEYLGERYSSPILESFNNTYIAEENIV